MATLMKLRKMFKPAASWFAALRWPWAKPSDKGLEAVWKLDDCITYIFPNASYRPDWMDQTTPEKALAVARVKFGSVVAGWEFLLETNLLKSDVEYRRVEDGEPQMPGDVVVGICSVKGDHIAKIGDNHLPIGRTEYGYETVMFSSVSSVWRAK